MKLFTVNLPDIGEGVVEGEVVQWLKQEGEFLKQDEPVVLVMTDKATVELPAVHPGLLKKQHVQIGNIAMKDHPLYDIELEDSDLEICTSKKEKKVDSVEIKASVSPENKADKALVTNHCDQKKALATPSTRKLARELDININQVQGSGKDGRVTKEDLKGFQSKKSIATGSAPMIFCAPKSDLTPVHNLDGDERIPLRGLRKLIARKMVESKSTIPHFAYFDEVDMTKLVKLRSELKEEASKEGVHLTYMPFFIKALSLALKKYPQVNSSLDLNADEIVTHKIHNVGMAVATDTGLIVPVIRNTEKKSILQIAKEVNDLAQKTRIGKVSVEELKGSTITISNVGTIGGLFATPIINYPEVAILGLTKMQKRPVVFNDEIVIREMMNLSWCFDHRVVDGAVGAMFSNEFIRYIQNPSLMILA